MHNNKDEHPKTRQPHHIQTKEWLNTTDMPSTITTQRI